MKIRGYSSLLTCHIRFCPQAEFYAKTYKIIVISGFNQFRDYNSTPRDEWPEAKASRQIKKLNPDIKILLYEATDFGLSGWGPMVLQAHPEWWLKDDNGKVSWRLQTRRKTDLLAVPSTHQLNQATGKIIVPCQFLFVQFTEPQSQLHTLGHDASPERCPKNKKVCTKFLMKNVHILEFGRNLYIALWLHSYEQPFWFPKAHGASKMERMNKNERRKAHHQQFWKVNKKLWTSWLVSTLVASRRTVYSILTKSLRLVWWMSMKHGQWRQKGELTFPNCSSFRVHFNSEAVDHSATHWHLLSSMYIIMWAVRITSLNPKFNGSHFGSPPQTFRPRHLVWPHMGWTPQRYNVTRLPEDRSSRTDVKIPATRNNCQAILRTTLLWVREPCLARCHSSLCCPKSRAPTGKHGKDHPTRRVDHPKERTPRRTTMALLKRKRKVEGRGRGRERKRKGKKEEGKGGKGNWKWSFGRNGKNRKRPSRESNPGPQQTRLMLYHWATETSDITS